MNFICKKVFILFLNFIPFVCLAENQLTPSQTCEQETIADFCFACERKMRTNISALKEVKQALQVGKLSTKARYIIYSMSKISNCPDRIWPGLTLTKKPYIVLDKSSGTSVVVTHDKCGVPSYRSPNDSEVTQNHFESKSHFEITSINKKKGVIIKWSENPKDLAFSLTSDKAFSLLVHEAFHVCDQSHKHWEKVDELKKGVDRFSQKTEGCTPRKYRAYIRHYLEKALKKGINSDGYKTALQKAAWWNKEYRKKFPEEFKLANIGDIVEGSAEFATVRAKALREKGCQAREEELQKAYSKHYFKGRGRYPKVLETPDSEAYNIGSLASALLEKSSSPGWHKKIEEGVSPVQLLLKDIPTKNFFEKVEGIEAGCRSFESAVKYREFSVQNINDQLASENHVALSIIGLRKGTFLLRGSANSGMKGYDQALLDAHMKIDTGTSHIAFEDVHLLIPEKMENNCGVFQRVVLIPKSAVSKEKDNSTYTIDFSMEKDSISNATGAKMKLKSSLKGKVLVKKKIKKEGADIWCAR